MLYEKLKYLIEQHISGNISRQEKSELQELLDHPEAEAVFNRLFDELDLSELPRFHQSQATAEQIFTSITGYYPQNAAPVKKISSLFYYAAASVILLIVSGIFFYLSQRTEVQPAPQATIIKTQPQAHKYLMLPDSSMVVLNEGSSLTFRDFAGKTREVQLSGEAFFDIKRDAQRPFIVHTGRVKTTVLGTAFNIRTDTANHITVTVTRGKVKVEDGNHPVALLIPNQQVTVDTLSGVSNNATVEASDVISWSQQGLKFNDSPLAEVALAIEMRFGRLVVFSDSTLKAKHVTAEFVKEETMENVLDVITKVNRMQYKMDTDKITISPQ